ncbi:MAG TPA: formate--tetrahydrofolate ligase, partial [Tessaracoccus flavescens]|nr:formate--tetrahydrofolate ligase [Tessaracoccus flavescens]
MEIAQQATPLPISTIAERLGISAEQIEPYGRFKAKIPLNVLEARPYRREGRLVLVTAVSPT